ncbi:MAG: hypothetical protein GVY36_17230 [Verrucomicrobia bacterium]|jgi:signal transduction histidine kinase|nr:hypothetical protein [Verrucomicrobiota bacterium]
MNEQDKLRFQPRARIIRTIGDQLISGPAAAIIELVKNAYDADASRVEIAFYPPLAAGEGRISIGDDGHGMSLDDIRLKWLEPATSSKAKQRLSPKKQRPMMGSKGIGRFAAAKLGQVMSLTSTVRTEDGGTSILIPELDWSVFSDDTYLADVAIDYIEQPSDGPSGTIIEILHLSQDWTKSRLEQLYAELRRLLSPFVRDDDDGFAIYLDLSHCTQDTCGFDGAAIVNGHRDRETPRNEDGPEPDRVYPFPLLSACDYELEGTFDEDGVFSGTFQNRRAGRAPNSVNLEIAMGEDEGSPGSFGVHLFIFDREAPAIKSNMAAAGMGHLNAADARKLLDSIAGVAIYRDDFRIRPYGDPQNDWLALDSRRVQDPSIRIGHNQVAGYITVGPQEDTRLVERSSREGLEDNAAFRRLTRLVSELLTKVVEPRRYKFRSEAGLARKRSTTFEEVRQISELKQIRTLVSKLVPEEREKAEKIIDREALRLKDRIEQLQERQRVLEAQSSLGGIIGEVLHEGGPRATFIAKNARRMATMLPSLLGGSGEGANRAREVFSERTPMIADSAEVVANLFQRLKPLAGSKRGKPRFFYPGQVIRDATKFFETHDVSIHVANNSEGMELVGYPDDLTTAVVNLVGNAVHWVEESQRDNPEVRILITRTGDHGNIFIEDNGPGIPEEFVDQIFDVGFSLREGGTGLGLNIAREALARSGANLVCHLENDEGAVFEITFPARADNAP